MAMVGPHTNVEVVPRFERGAEILSQHLDGMRRTGRRNLSYDRGFGDEDLNGSAATPLSRPRVYNCVNVGTSAIEQKDIVGLADISNFYPNGNFRAPVDLASTNYDWVLVSEGNIGPTSNGWCIPVMNWTPVEVNYTGTVPQINDELGITNGKADKDAQDKVLVAVSVPNTQLGRIWVIKLGGGEGGEQVSTLEFKTTAIFTVDDLTVPIGTATGTEGDPLQDADFWTGPIPNPKPTVVANSGGMFFGPEPNLYGIAIQVSNDDATNTDEYQIIQLDCIAPSDQGVYSQEVTDGNFSYNASTIVPFDTFEVNQGDLIQLEADGTITFARDSYGTVRVQLEAQWISDETTTRDGEESILSFETNLGGGGWSPVADAGISFFHFPLRIPPNDYWTGGVATRSYWSQNVFQAGDQVRIMASSRGSETVPTMRDVALEILESNNPAP